MKGKQDLPFKSIKHLNFNMRNIAIPIMSMEQNRMGYIIQPPFSMMEMTCQLLVATGALALAQAGAAPMNKEKTNMGSEIGITRLFIKFLSREKCLIRGSAIRQARRKRWLPFYFQ